jgi:hypothetical protein
VFAVVDALLSRGLSTVAIAATNLALRDLAFDDGPGETGSKHVRDVLPFVGHVVELKDDWIRLAAVDTRVRGQILPRSRSALECGSSEVHFDAFLLVVGIAEIPLSLVFSHALATPSKAFTSPPVTDVELLDGLF